MTRSTPDKTAVVHPVPRVLSIAGTDPTGGAGIQADLKSIAVHGGYGMAVVTALVAQNTRGVRAVHIPDAGFLTAQLDAVSDDVTIDAVKIGMLGTAEVIRTVRDWLVRVRPPVVVLDPVMVATSGDRLLDPQAEQGLRELAAHVDLLTPNVPELAVLAGQPVAGDWSAVLDQARAVSRDLSVAVLAKGGHMVDGDSVRDALVDERPGTPDSARLRQWTHPRSASTTTHGTGCSLSAAIATLRAAGRDWPDAVDEATAWLAEAIDRGPELQVGGGAGPVHHFAALWDRAAARPTAGQVRGRWWRDVADLRTEIEDLEFVRRLGDGSLTPEVFAWYLGQDVLYLREYARVLAQASTLAPTPQEQEFWAVSARQALVAEQGMHGRYLGADAGQATAAPTTTAYVDHLLSAGVRGGYDLLVAAVLPCFWLYEHVGSVLHAQVTLDHPFGEWLSTYGDPGFAERSRGAQQIVAGRAAAVDPVTRAAMFQAFQVSCRHEREFFAAPLAQAPSHRAASSQAAVRAAP